MRKFLNTLYVLNKDAYLSLEGENIVLLCNKAEIGRVAPHAGGHRLLQLCRGQPRPDGQMRQPRGRFELFQPAGAAFWPGP